MDRPVNRAMITGVLMLDRPPDLARLRQVIEQRLLRHDRFRQRVRMPALGLGMPRWEIDPYFDPAAHLHRIALPAPGDMSALQELAGDLMSTPLDYGRPLWQLHAVEGVAGGGALIARLHHCIADGLALVQVLLSLADPERDVAPEAVAVPAEPAEGGLLEALLHPALSVLDAAWRTAHVARDLALGSLATVSDPARLRAAAKSGGAGAAALGKLLFTLPDRRTILRGHPGVVKRVAWSTPVPLADVKAVGRDFGSTVNDVLLTAVAGALRRYLEERGQPTDGLNIRAMVPYSVRTPAEAGQLGNRFGLVILSLPVGERDPQQRLLILKRRMDDIKDTPEALVAYGILNGIGLTPVAVEKIIVDIFAAKVTAVMTNVPGPASPLYLAGSRLDGMMFWVPTGGELGLGISILSYAGQVFVGIATDAGLIPDPGAIVEAFQAELAGMRE
jgi:WS/DGAT/MGAT family acyltransferase